MQNKDLGQPYWFRGIGGKVLLLGDHLTLQCTGRDSPILVDGDSQASMMFRS